eukprot:4942964-Amphidinium_carterae.1
MLPLLAEFAAITKSFTLVLRQRSTTQPSDGAQKQNGDYRRSSTCHLHFSLLVVVARRVSRKIQRHR